jgi:hypothetical protein
VLYEKLTEEEIEAVKPILSINGWILPPALRAVLYRELFRPLSSNQCKVWQNFIPNILNGHVKILRQLEIYAVDQLTRYRDGADGGEKAHSSLLDFVEDVINLVRILRTSLIPFSSLADVPLSHPIYQFTPSTFISMSSSSPANSTLENADLSKEVWKEWPYMRGLIDAIFGLPLMEENHSYLSNYSCPISEILDGVALRDREGEAPTLDYRTLDASNIESYGPFRFRATDRLANHLKITPNNEILFYIHWPTWARIINHNVLLDTDDFDHSVPYTGTKFDVITSLSRNPVAPFSFGGMRGHIIGLYSDISIHAYVFFFQDVVNCYGKDHSARIRYWESFRTLLRGKLRPMRSTSLDIARRLGINISESELAESGRAILAMVGGDWEDLLHPRDNFRRHGAFKYRLDKVHDTLMTWRPKTIRELRYTGYGGVDPLSPFLFYLASVFGIISLVWMGASVSWA